MSKSNEDNVKWWRSRGLYHGMGNKATDLLYKQYDHGLKLKLNLADKMAYVTMAPVELSGQEKLPPGIFQNILNVKVGLDLKSRYARINTTLECSKNSSILCSIIVGTNYFSQQNDISIDATSGNFTKCDFGWNSRVKSTIFTLTMCDMGETMKTSLYHSFSRRTKTVVGLEVVYRQPTDRTVTVELDRTITIGAQRKLNRSTLVKVCGNNRGRVGVVVQRQLKPTSQFTLFGEADIKAIRETAKMGMGLAFKI